MAQRDVQRWIKQGADAEFKRLEPRNNKLKQAVEVRNEMLASLNKEVRALRADVSRLKADHKVLEALESSAREDANLMAELRATVAADAAQIDALRQKVKYGDEQRQDWMQWAWKGQPKSKNSDGAVYEAKIAALESAVGYWMRRAQNLYPATTQTVADLDAAVDFRCRHLRLDDILRLAEMM